MNFTFSPQFGAVSLYRDDLRKPVTAVSVDRALVEEAGLADRVKLSPGGFGSVYANGTEADSYRREQQEVGEINTKASLRMRDSLALDQLPPMTDYEREQQRKAHARFESVKRDILAKLAGPLGNRKP